MKKAFPQWKGFEFTPLGSLLEQVVELNGDMGIAYERSCDFYKDFHTHDRLMLVFPRGNSVMKIQGRNPNCSYNLDRSSGLIVPRLLEHDDTSLSAIYDTFALYPSHRLLSRIAKKQQISISWLENVEDKYMKFERSPWLEQLIQQYFAERVLSKSRDTSELCFFESQIIREVFRILRRESVVAEVTSGNEGEMIQKAIRFLETNLFNDVDLKGLSKVCGGSKSTLLRNFKRDVGLTPYAYTKKRRMEEARALLNSGKYNVGQVAALVGYENLGAFTDAFKSIYHRLPSSLLK